MGPMTSHITIRRAQPGDEDALALVGQATFLDTFAGILEGPAIIAHCQSAHSAAKYRSWLADPDAAIWIAQAGTGHAPIGYAVLATPDLPLADPATDLELKRIYLLGRFHGGGIGKRLLDGAVMHARAVGAARVLLGVYQGNSAALAFYRRQGFASFTTRQFNVGGRLYDDQVMRLVLDA